MPRNIRSLLSVFFLALLGWLAYRATEGCPVCPPSTPARMPPPDLSRATLAVQAQVPAQLAAALPYREEVAKKTSPPKNHGAFSHVYVANLAHRSDRKKYMQALGRAQDLDMTFVEAVRKDSDEMKWIMEQKYQDYVAKISRPDGFGPDGKMDWKQWYIKHLFEPEKYPLVTEGLDTSPIANMGFGDQPLANQFGCFATHLKMMVQMMQNDDDHALILEDDVDFEWTFRDTWRELFPSLKNNWAIVYVAYIYSSELPSWSDGHITHGHPRLRAAIRPMGTMGYVLSHSGVKDMFAYLTTSQELFNQPIDMAMADHIPSLGPQRALSTVPRLVGHVGGHAFGSDIMGGSAWADTLGDSTRNRLIAFGDTSAMGSSKD